MGCWRCKSKFLLGATSGRATNGEGLQHQDGHSHLLAQTIPNCKSYDPCFSYELATIIQDGIEDMYVKNNDSYYYITLMNENYHHPKRPKSATNEAILAGAYKFIETKQADVRILASGVTLRFAIEAAENLRKMNIFAEVWSVTSFNQLAKEGLNTERSKFFSHKCKKSYVEQCFEHEMPTVAVSEYMRSYSEQIRKFINGKYICLGTDGFGRSDTREKLRRFFEIDKDYIVYAALLATENSD